MQNNCKTVSLIWAIAVFCHPAVAGGIYQVTLDTSSLVGHPAGPFYVFGEFTDGSGIGDGNNTVDLGAFAFGGGSALGDPLVFGGASGSLETAVTITDSSLFSFFAEPFAPGLQLSFSLDLTSNDDLGGTPDRFVFFLLDSSEVPLPTLAPAGDYFFGVDLRSTGPVFDSWASDPSRSPSLGGPVSIPAPAIVSVDDIPEPSMFYLLGGVLVTALVKRRFTSS